MGRKECAAMILAGGRGERLGALTHYHSKPAIYFGGSNRIIDFALSNCKISGIDTVAVLSQYFTADLNEYLRSLYNGNPERAGIHVLMSRGKESMYTGTADAVRKNISFLERFAPEHVLILASDHVYRMDYKKMIEFHKRKKADVTVAAVSVPVEEASMFGILNAWKDGRVFEFEEKPSNPKTSLASMGVYVFTWEALKYHLARDSRRESSHHDFGKDILPEILSEGRLYTYLFDGYWRDVGTVEKLWEANMDQLGSFPVHPAGHGFSIPAPHGGEYANFISDRAAVRESIISGGCSIFGKVRHSVLGSEVTVGPGAEVMNSVIMPGAYIGSGVKLYNTIVGTHAAIMDDAVIGAEAGVDFFVDMDICGKDVSLVSPWLYVEKGIHIQKNSHICKAKLDAFSPLQMEKSGFTREVVSSIAG